MAKKKQQKERYLNSSADSTSTEIHGSCFVMFYFVWVELILPISFKVISPGQLYQCQWRNSGVGVTKAVFANFSVSNLFDLAKVFVKFPQSHSYFPGATADTCKIFAVLPKCNQRQQAILNMNLNFEFDPPAAILDGKAAVIIRDM